MDGLTGAVSPTPLEQAHTTGPSALVSGVRTTGDAGLHLPWCRVPEEFAEKSRIFRLEMQAHGLL